MPGAHLPSGLHSQGLPAPPQHVWLPPFQGTFMWFSQTHSSPLQISQVMPSSGRKSHTNWLDSDQVVTSRY